MENFIDLLSTAGLPTSFVGVCLFIIFTVQKQLAGVRAEQIATIERLKIDVKELSADKDKLSDKVDELRKENGEYLGRIASLQAKLISVGVTLQEEE